MTKLEKIRLKGWKSGSMTYVGGVESRNSQIGQLLYYLVVVQLQQLQEFLSPLKQPCNITQPKDVLGFFMEQGKVCVY